MSYQLQTEAYLKKMLENQNAAADKEVQANSLLAAQNKTDALNALKSSNRVANNTYMQNSGKYGVAAEQRASGGLMNSSYGTRQGNSLYDSYQQSLGTAGSNYLSSIQSINNDSLNTAYKAEATKFNNLAGYNNNMYSNYLKLLALGY